MAERRAPRPTNGSPDKVPVKTYVTVDKWGEVMDRAEKAGISVSSYLSTLIDRDELDADGRPTWAPPPAEDTLPGIGSKAAA